MAWLWLLLGVQQGLPSSFSCRRQRRSRHESGTPPHRHNPRHSRKAGAIRWGPEPHFAELTPLGYRLVPDDHTMQDDEMDGPAESPLFDADESAETLEAVAEARRRISGVPASVIVSNHAMGLFELAAIHLSDEPPRLDDARLAIDALGHLVEGLGERLGEHHDTIAAALANIRLVFVQRSRTPLAPENGD